ncbi:MAG: hypothetical protein KatS3mg087_0102 [Patescibacteria group bacterium]|nr:MAG: hypothetical protein KatS3mg087_0102 [Patescibacteria group bacterium]
MRQYLYAITFTAVVFALGQLFACDNPELKGMPVGVYLQKISVNIKSGSGQGSGTIFVTEVEGKKTAFVVTAYHVVEDLRKVRDIIAPDGSPRKRVEYDDAVILQEQVDNGRVVGEIRYDAKVICVDSNRDIAILRVRKTDAFTVSGYFYDGSDIPQPGTEVYHCGAPGGSDLGGSASLTSGIISRVGVRITDFSDSEYGIYDQVDCAALPGSSGGLVALKSCGCWIGMITIGVRSSDNFHWIVPVRTVRQFAKEAKLEWLVDPKLPRPTEKDLESIPVELHQTIQSRTGKESIKSEMDLIPEPIKGSSEGFLLLVR